MGRVVYDSNGQPVGDGVRVTRVSDNGQTLEVMTDPKLERFSRIILVDENSKRTIETFTSSEWTQPGDYIRAEAVFHREFIKDMEPDMKVRYLLEMLELHLSGAQEKFALIKDVLPAAKRRSCHMLDILWTARPRLLTYGYIAKQIEYISGSYIDTIAINSNIKLLRRALETTDWPIEIINHPGMGYSLKSPENWEAPWEAH